SSLTLQLCPLSTPSPYTTLFRSTRDGTPVAADPPIADYMCAMTLAFGIASALFRRAITGRGGEVDVSLLMAALVVQNNALVRVRSEEHTSELQSRVDLVCRLLLE